MKEKSDPSLVSEVRKYGVFNERGCFNCGSCTVVCDLATDSAPFPRRTIQSVLFGLKESLHQSLDPWLCHDCGDCSITCPRDAKPRESMMTLRRYLSAQYDWTGLSGRIGRFTALEIVALSSVALFVLALIILYHLYFERMDLEVFRSTPMGLEHMFPAIIYLTCVAYLIPAFFFASHAVRMLFFTMRPRSGSTVPLRFYLAEAKSMILRRDAPRPALRCRTTVRRRGWIVAHALLASGSVLMFIIKFFFLKWFQTDNLYGLYNPQRWLGYIGAVFLVVGALGILIEQGRRRESTSGSFKLMDPILPVLLLLTALSGISVHVFRYLGFALTTHYVYALHLMIAVSMLLVEVPFGKSSHVIFRPLSRFFAGVRERFSEGLATAKEKAA